MLNKYCDQIYCINLERRTDRKERFISRLNGGARTDDSKLTFIKAVDGSRLLNVPVAFNKPWPPHQSAGAYGCLQSHMNTIKDAKEKNYETILHTTRTTNDT